MTHRRGGRMYIPKEEVKFRKKEIEIEFEGRIYKSYSSLYKAMPFPKVQVIRFVKRLKDGLDPLSAASTGREDPEKKTVTEKKKYEPNYITITLKKDEARAIDRVYREEIQKLDAIVDEEEVNQDIILRLERLIDEYNVFKKYQQKL